jgi:hypothetical protein
VTKTAVKRCNRDVERLKPSLDLVFESASMIQRKLAAKISKPDPRFREEISKNIILFLFAGIAAANRVAPADRVQIKKMLRSRQAARRAIEAACSAWQRCGPLHDDFNKALETSKQHEKFAASALNDLKKLKRGARPYRAFNNFVRALAQQYALATGKEARVQLNNARGYDDRCSGAFAEFLEECFDQSKKIWSAAGFKSHLPAPIHKGGRLEYARKALQPKRVAALQGRKSTES